MVRRLCAKLSTMQRMTSLWAALAIDSASMSCSSVSGGPSSQAAAPLQVQQQLAGVWRVTSYIPVESLSPALLVSMHGDKILVRFDDGRVRSVSPSLTFDRAYRLADVKSSEFTIFIADESGVEIETHCQFDDRGRILFHTISAPWAGRGVLDREGPAASR